MPETSPNAVAISAATTVPDQLRPDSLSRVVQGDLNLTAFQKRQLIKQLFRMKFNQRQEQFRASLDVDKYRLDAQVALVKNKIDVEKDTIALKIREEFLKTLADLGMRVELSQLDFLSEFGTKLKSFRRRLETHDIDPEEKERILQMSHNAFDRVYNRLMELVSRMTANNAPTG